MQSIGDFQMEGKMMRYRAFVERLYNFCISLGFTPGKIMPSRAFCSDENQGFPIILITNHLGTFPFNHGRVGGIVATDRHGSYAHHGQDLVIVQASHVFLLTIDNQLLDEERSEGLFINLEMLLTSDDDGHYESVCSLSTSKCSSAGNILQHYWKKQKSILVRKGRLLIYSIPTCSIFVVKLKGRIIWHVIFFVSCRRLCHLQFPHYMQRN